MVVTGTAVLLALALQSPPAAPRATPPRPARPAARTTAATPTAAPSPVPTPASVPFADGETSTYAVSWSGMTAGTATLSVKANRGANGIDTWSARAETVPSSMLSSLYTLRYLAESTFGARDLLPRRSLVDSTEGKRRRIRRTTFDHATKKVQYSVTIGDTVTRSIDIASESQDILSIIYKVRTLPLAVGFRKSIPVSDNGRRYTFEISVAEKTTLKTPLGDLPAWKIAPRVVGEKGAVEPGQKILWLSADDRHLLLRAESVLTVGKVILELSSFTPGRE